MRLRDGLILILLGAIWGASFLFMRIAAPEFGPAPLMLLRVGIAAAFLLPILLWRENLAALWKQPRQLLFLGFVNSAFPFLLFAYAATKVTAGYLSILNSTASLWGGLVAWLWLKDRLKPAAVVGLMLGFSGVVTLVMGRKSFATGGEPLAIAGCLLATLCYAIAVNYTKKQVTGISALAISTGSLIAATVMLAPFAAMTWPENNPSLKAWLTVSALAIVCTGIAYVFYFRLIRSVGPSRAMSVTYLVPMFGVAWGAIFLQEQITIPMIVGTLVILSGVGLTTGALPLSRGPRPRPLNAAEKSLAKS